MNEEGPSSSSGSLFWLYNHRAGLWMDRHRQALQIAHGNNNQKYNHGSRLNSPPPPPPSFEQFKNMTVEERKNVKQAYTTLNQQNFPPDSDNNDNHFHQQQRQQNSEPKKGPEYALRGLDEYEYDDEEAEAVEWEAEEGEYPEFDFDDPEFQQQIDEQFSDLDPELIEFFRQSLLHKQTREKEKDELRRRGLWYIQTTDDYVEPDQVAQQKDVTTRAPDGVKESDRRRQEAARLYGDQEITDQILSLEVVLRMNFDQAYDRYKPPFWPNIPLNLSPCIQALKKEKNSDANDNRKLD